MTGHGNRFLGVSDAAARAVGWTATDDLPAHAWPGSYSIYYIDGDGSVICADCANRTVQQNADQIEDDWQNEDRADVLYYRCGQDRIEHAGTVEGDEDGLWCDDCSNVIAEPIT